MASRWTKKEERLKKKELKLLYVRQNKTIGEIGNILGLAENSVYDRLVRLGISSLRHKKQSFNNQNYKIQIPKKMSLDLSEFIGILLGDGHLTPTQVCVTLGTKEKQYAEYVLNLMTKLFNVRPKISVTQESCITVYLGSTLLVRWLFKNFNLVYNKVKLQVDVPYQCFSRLGFMRQTLRRLFDTDGSVYRLKYGIQMSLTNKSQRLLGSSKKMLEDLGYHPSAISSNKIYLTRADDIKRYRKEIGFKNSRHLKRMQLFKNEYGRFV